MAGFEMTSISDSIASSLRVLRNAIQRVIFPSQPISDICRGINDQIEAFEPGFRFLAFLEDCNHKLSDDEFVRPHLAIKIEATIQEIVNQVEGGEVQRFREEIMEIFYGFTIFLESTNFQKRASRIFNVFTNLNAKIDLLKPEIREALEHLSTPLFQPHYAIRDLDDWRKLVDSVRAALGEVRHDHISVILQNLSHFRRFLDDISKKAKAEYILMHGLNVAIRTALVSCHWWASQFDRNMEEDVSIALLDLRRKIEFIDPESLDLILKQLKTAKQSRLEYDMGVELFVRDLLPFRRRLEEFTGKSFELNDHPLPFTLIKELEYLTFYVLGLTEENAKSDQLLELKLLILEIEESFSSYSLENLLLNFLAKSCLLKTEVCLVAILTGDNFLCLPAVDMQIDALKEGLQQIKELPEERSENVNQILAILEEAYNLEASLLQSCHAGDITTDMVGTMLYLLSVKILLLKLDRKLYNYNHSSMFFDKNTVQSLLEGLKFWAKISINQQGGIAMGGVLDAARIEPMARKVIFLYHSFLSHNIAEETVENMNLTLSSLLDEIKLSMAKLRDTYIHIPRSKFPKTNAILGFFDSLLSKLRELLYHMVDLLLSMEQQFIEILGHLEFFRDFLGDILQPERKIQDIRDLCGHIINVAYEAEYVVDFVVVSKESECHNLVWFYNVLQDIRHMKVQVTKAQEKKASDVKVHNLPHTSRHLVSKTSNPRIDGNLLTLNDQQEVIIDRLIGGCEQQEIVSIVGMPGVGKTTLAKNVYSSPAVVCHFHVRAWCCVTEVYRKRELLLEILSQIILLTDKIRGMSNEDLEFKLRQLVLKKRYLIVMDDIWNIGAWDDLRSSFPEDDNGSRILITSRLNHVALKASARSDPHHLRLLSDAESWDLLQMKIFNEERCPEEFIEVGQAIAKNCKGLPLAIVTMAGILKRTDRQANGWKEIARNLSSRIIVDDPEEQCRDILELSYKLLPDYLQACFLYFGAFLEDQEIPVRKLIQLWIAEGFVQKTDLKSLEDLAEDYLEDLIGRNLVLFAQPRSSVGTKRCRVHDMLRNLCQSKAKEDNFLQVITRSNESDASFDDLDFVLDVNFSNSSNYKTYGDHRLCFYSKRNYFVESKPSDPYVRSLLFFATNDKYARSSYDISFISHNFILLKVLDLECINMGPSFPGGIELMVQLRYLGVSGDVDSVPSSIANLWNLETFVVKGLKGKVNLPDAIWCLKKLRHVHVSDIAVINLQDDKLGNSSLLECLVTLSSPFLPNKEETNNILRKFPNLRKLGCIFSKSPNCSGTYDLFPRLDVLTRLESLKICYYGGALHTAKFVFPLSLKKLTLSNFRLPWSHISVIGRLQNLEVLKLLSKAYDGERWDMVEGEFQNLRFLKLDSLNIAQWNASSDNLPKLEQLVLRNCKLLQEVPSTFVELCTLQVIEVQWCGKSVEKSVRRMREEADEHLKVIITSELESRSSV